MKKDIIPMGWANQAEVNSSWARHTAWIQSGRRGEMPKRIAPTWHDVALEGGVRLKTVLLLNYSKDSIEFPHALFWQHNGRSTPRMVYLSMTKLPNGLCLMKDYKPSYEDHYEQDKSTMLKLLKRYNITWPQENRP